MASLWAAKHVGAVRVIVHSNSQLASQQLEETYEVKNDRLHKYVEAYEKIKAEFQEVILQKVLREEIRKYIS